MVRHFGDAKSSRVFAFLDASPCCINNQVGEGKRDRETEQEGGRDIIDVPARDVPSRAVAAAASATRFHDSIPPFAYISRRSWLEGGVARAGRAWQMAVSAALLCAEF